jgi:hypothetical protein
MAKKGHIPWNKGKTGVYTEKTKKQISDSLKKYFKTEGLIEKNGYLQFKVPKGCRFSIMKNAKGYIPVHRLAMAAYLQRPLTSEEVVHHINGNMTDNRLDNLELMTQSKHVGIHNKLRVKNLK